MPMVVALMLQAGPPAPASAAPLSTAPVTIDLRPFAPPACRPSVDPTDVTVCGRRDAESFRLRPLSPERGDPLLPAARARIGGGTVSVEGESATLAGGAISKRAMVRLKLPF